MQVATFTLQDHFFDSSSVPIRFTTKGSGSAVVLLHGFTGNADSWVENGIYDGPWDGFQLIAMDCRGSGKSGKPHDPAAYGIEMVNDVARLLDYLSISQAHLLGHSMGAEIALKAVSMYPDRTRSAVLASGGWWDDSIYECCRRTVESLEQGEGMRGYFDWATPTGRVRTAAEIKALDKWNQAMLARNDPQALAAMCRNYFGPGALLFTEEEVRAIQAPLLGIAGELDVEGPNVQRMRGVAPHFTLIVLQGQGHGGPEFMRVLAQEAPSFFRKIEAQGPDG